MPDTPDIRIETCSAHGLRFNAAIHSGCARCRKEAGELIGHRPRAGQPVAASGGSHAPMAGALGLAVLLILLAGTAFYWSHQQLWTLGQTVLGTRNPAELGAEHYEKLGELAEKLGEAARDLDPEARDALLEMGRQLQQQGVPIDVDGQLGQENQERLRRQIEQIEPVEEDAGGEG